AGTDQGQQHIGSYSLSVFFYPADEYEGYGDNDTPATAAAINLGQEVVGTIGVPGDVDCYRVVVDCPGLMVQRTRRFPLALAFTTIDPAGKEIVTGWNHGGQNLDREYHVPGTGLHLLKINGVNPAEFSPASYVFWLELIRIKPETKLNKRLVLALNSGIKLDALLPGNVKTLMIPVVAAATLTIGARIPIAARLIVNGPDGGELFNSWNHAGQPLQASIKLDTPANLLVTVAATDPAGWSKDSYFIYATDGDLPPQPVLMIARIAEDNRTVTFNVSGSPAGARRIKEYELDFEGNGKFSKVAMGLVEHTYRESKLYAPKLRVTDDRGAAGTESTFLDLVDVSLTGLSCRVISPGDGEVVQRPQKVAALAGSGPGKRVNGMKLLLDGRPIATSRLSHIEADVDWRSLAPGDHAISVEASDADGHKAGAAAKFRVSGLFELWPEHGEVITGTRVVVTWFSPEAADTLVEYRKVGDSEWHR
ncbi:MAG: PKD domain-containing protein, partial [Desulfobacterales bacterium]|nr:PKD domain-containing protein [Desulfobacterales bacterium]